MLSLKPGVRISGIRPELLLAIIAAERVFEKAGHDVTVTACVEGKHAANSLHYVGLAVDLRTKDILPADALGIIARIKVALGDDFDVVHEVDHVHIEFQPKTPVSGA